MNDRHTAIVLAAKRLPQILAARDAADARLKAAIAGGDAEAATRERATVDAHAEPLRCAQQATAKLRNPQVLVDHAIRERSAAREARDFARAGQAPAEVLTRLEAQLAGAEAAVAEAEGLRDRQAAAVERAASDALAAEKP